MVRPVLVTGGTGQLATTLARAGRGLPVVVVGRPRFDFDRPETIEELFASIEPRAVVNAAAYTAVDAAEADPAAAFRANRDGPARLARLCTIAGIPLIHISTDYVFDGTKGAPYLEADPTAPLGVYGASKRAGEQAVLESSGMAAVLRTSWVISATGRNFVRTMLAAGRKAHRLSVVADQRGRPTAAADLAAAVLAVMRRIEGTGWQQQFGGVFHVAGGGETTWHGLATAVFEEAAHRGMAPPEIVPIATADWPTPARRPPDSRLDCTRLAQVFGLRLPPWRDSLGTIIDELLGGPPS
ncbi:MAG: dTDP-4-dehydrorhamnose reductase [Rhodospirillales bacterium]|nr:dTDP-4-dehydrorhamnose reductase [Rhodospirillales bacterium]